MPAWSRMRAKRRKARSLISPSLRGHHATPRARRPPAALTLGQLSSSEPTMTRRLARQLRQRGNQAGIPLIRVFRFAQPLLRDTTLLLFS